MASKKGNTTSKTESAEETQDRFALITKSPADKVRIQIKDQAHYVKLVLEHGADNVEESV